MAKGIIKRYFTGTSSKKQHALLLILALVILASFWITAQLLFEGQYSPLNNTISNQGRTDYNPRGFIFFTLGCTISGLLLILHFIYLYRNYYPTLKLILQISFAAGLVGSFAFIFIGFVPGDINKPLHSFFARLAFGAFYASAFSLLAVMVRKIQLKEAWPSIKQVGIVYAIFGIILLLVIIVPELDALATVLNVDERLFDWPIWQWTAFFNIIIWLINVYLIIPARKNQSEPKSEES